MPADGSVQLVVVGSINHDLAMTVAVLPVPGETTMAQRTTRHPGGKGANQAVAAARVGTPTAMVARVGADLGGRDGREQLRAGGVEDSCVDEDLDAPTGTAVVLVDDTGENIIVVDPGANHRLDASSATAALARLHAEHGSALSTVLAQGEIPAATVDAVGQTAQELGLRFVLNLAPVIDVRHETLSRCDPLILNEVEAAELVRRTSATGDEPLRADASLDRLASSFDIPVVITVGSQGALYTHAGACWLQPPATGREVVDTTGAGDAFCGVLAAALARGSDLPTAVRVGVLAGTHAVASAGTVRSYLDEQTLQAAGAHAPSAVMLRSGAAART